MKTDMFEKMLLKMMNRFTITIAPPSVIGMFIKRLSPEKLESLTMRMGNVKTGMITSTMNSKQILAMVSNLTGEQLFSIISAMGDEQLDMAVGNMPSDSLRTFLSALDSEKTGAIVKGLTRRKVASIAKALTAEKMRTIVRSFSPENMAILVRGMSPGMMTDFISNSSIDIIGAMIRNLTPYKLKSVLFSLDIDFWKKTYEDVATGDVLEVLKEYSTMILNEKLIEDIERLVVRFGGNIMDRFIEMISNPRFQGMFDSLIMSFIQTLLKPENMTTVGSELGKAMPPLISSSINSIVSPVTRTISDGVDQIQETVNRIFWGKIDTAESQQSIAPADFVKHHYQKAYKQSQELCPHHGGIIKIIKKTY